MGQDASHPVRLPPSHFLPIAAAPPPAGCPMHTPTPPPPKPKPMKLPPPGCPMHDPSAVPPPPAATPAAAAAAAPASPAAEASLSSSTAKAAGCPIDHSALSPLNMMPPLAQTPLSPTQATVLSTEREVSTIPRTLSSTEDPTIPADAKHWVYPSAQQFYNALVRKGFETDEEDVDSMVFVHNVLNEVAWKQVLEWEARRKGIPVEQETEAELMRFKGRPGTLSPKAQWYLFLGQWFPETYNTEPPFDRHDWVVRRPSTNSEHRYVIDYYGAPDDADGSPNFHLDVRPALDDLDAVRTRLRAAVEDWLAGKE